MRAMLANSCQFTCASPPLSKRVEEMTDQKIVGRIIKVSKDGWGFISSRNIEFTRIFFHWTALRQDTTPFLGLKTGMQVEFTPLEIPGKGWRAIHIKVVEREKTVDNQDQEPQVPAL